MIQYKMLKNYKCFLKLNEGNREMKKLKVVLIGAGNRGTTYTDKMFEHPDMYEVVAVAEPINSRREYIKEKHGIKDDMCFENWRDMLKLGKIADLAIVSTMDREHIEPALAAIKLKYHLLLEKPIAAEPEECKKVADCAEENGVKVVVCTVLRYTPMFMTLKNIIDSGKIGEIMSINHEECVGNVHQSHSFVRGNWGREKRSTCMLLQKSCHDIDIIQWLIGKKCVKVQSYGTTSHFVKENAPSCAPDYCIEGCKLGDTCPYNAVKLYLDDKENDWFRTTCTREANPDDEMVKKAISETQYGKCVYKCDNDVVDQQTVNMLFEDDVTVTFSMNAFNKGGRFMHIFATKGEVKLALSDDETYIKLFDFETRKTEEISMEGKDGINGGHGGGDDGIICALYEYLNGEYKGNSIPEIRQSSDNHLITFAAEKSRKEKCVVDLQEYIESL